MENKELSLAQKLNFGNFRWNSEKKQDRKNKRIAYAIADSLAEVLAARNEEGFEMTASIGKAPSGMTMAKWADTVGEIVTNHAIKNYTTDKGFFYNRGQTVIANTDGELLNDAEYRTFPTPALREVVIVIGHTSLEEMRELRDV